MAKGLYQHVRATWNRPKDTQTHQQRQIEWFNGEENRLTVALINQPESTPLEDLATRQSRVSSWLEQEFAVVD